MTTTSDSFSVGDIVFAKLKSYPHWPGKIIGISPQVRKKTPKYNVLFFGDNKTADINSKDLFLYVKHKSVYGLPKKDNFRNRIFNKALQEADTAIGSVTKTHITSPSNPEEAISIESEDTTNINHVQNKIREYELTDELDLETSLTLAAEAGNALLQENNILKNGITDLKLLNHKLTFQLREANQTKSSLHQDMEEIIEELEDKVSALTDFTRNLSENNDHLSRKLTKEQRLKEELLAQADEEKKISDTILKQLQTLKTKSEKKIKYLAAELTNTTKQADDEILILCNENAQLISRGKETEQELKNYKVTLSKMEEEVEKNQLRFTEQINKFKLYTNSFLDNFMNSDSNTHLNTPVNNKTTSMLHREESPHSSVRGHMIRTMRNGQLDNSMRKRKLFSVSLQAAKYKVGTQSVNHTSEQYHNLTAEARQICANNTEPTLTTRTTSHYNSTAEARQICVNNTEPTLTTRTTSHYNSTAEARQICINNTEPTLTTRTTSHYNSTAEARQICINNTEPTLTTRTTSHYNSTAEARQICINNTEPTLTTGTTSHYNSTAEARQICVNNTEPTLTTRAESILTKMREHIFTVNSALCKSDKAKTQFTKTPPMYAKLKPENQSLDEFFAMNIQYYLFSTNYD